MAEGEPKQEPKVVPPLPGVYVSLTQAGEVRVECVALNNRFVAIALLELAKSILLKKMQTPAGRITVPGAN